MKQTNTESGRSFWSAVLCGVLSLFADFILIPVILALYLLERKTHVPPGYVWFGLPAQYLILIVFAAPISRIFSSDSWTYLWDAAVWPLGVTVAQFAVLIALRFRRTKSR